MTVVAMEELDADDKRLSFQGRFADRDIVQVGLYVIMPLSADDDLSVSA